jgi:hypothetical protein
MPPDPDHFIDHFVAVALNHIDREYPNKLDHVMNDAAEIKSPRDLHPVFYGSFDWHSNVHGFWLLARALRLYPALAQSEDIIKLFDARFTDDNIKAEVDYLTKPHRETFERTYGWAWLLKLAAELRIGALAPKDLPDETAQALVHYDAALAPLTTSFIDRFVKYLPKATYPIRVGVHQNTAFALRLAMDYARAAAHGPLEDILKSKARAWYMNDQNYPGWEPDGTDFLSPGLIEAECMRRILDEKDFIPWFDRFLPNLAAGEPKALFTPAFVSDRTDGQITHLDGLNLSRAWCWKSIGRALPDSDPRRLLSEKAYQTHLDSALSTITGNYMGEHWLATFALLALTE